MGVDDLLEKRNRLRENVEKIRKEFEKEVDRKMNEVTLKTEIAFLEEEKRLYEAYMRELQR